MQSSGMPWPGDEGDQRWDQAWMAIKKQIWLSSRYCALFGKAIVCSDAAAEAARYGFTVVDRPEGVLVLAVASLGEKVVEVTAPPEETKS